MHYYLHDTRRRPPPPPKQLTKGSWAVRGVSHVDKEARVLYFVAGGKEAHSDPYLRRCYSVRLDGADGEEPVLLTPEDADHEVWPPPLTSRPHDRWNS